MPGLENWDSVIQGAINAQAIPGFLPFFTALTMLGEKYAWIAGLGLYVLAGRRKMLAIALLLAILFGGVISEDIKDMVRRPRPEGSALPPILRPESYSFPSHHAQLSFMLATVLTAFLAWRYSLVAYSFAAAISFSRIYLGVHYLTDVVAGAITGIVFGQLVIFGLYRYGLAPGGGVIGYLAKVKPTATGSGPGEELLAVAVIICLVGLAIGASTMVAGWYAISLLVIALVYWAIVVLPDFLPEGTASG